MGLQFYTNKIYDEISLMKFPDFSNLSVIVLISLYTI